MPTSQENWIRALTSIGALWIHDENPLRPHALLTSGNHSKGFFNCSMLLRHPRVLGEACLSLIRQDSQPNRMDLFNRIQDDGVKMVVGSALGAITIAHEIAKHLGLEAGFTEKVDGAMALKRFPLKPNTPVIVVEDVMTTGGTTLETISAVEEAGGIVFDMIPVLVNRSEMGGLVGREIIALVDHEMPIWRPEECPLCEQGSEALRPKGNWDQLTAHYEEGS